MTSFTANHCAAFADFSTAAGEKLWIVGLGVTARHITERKRAEIKHGRLMELEQTLRQAQKMETLGQLTGSIAHDLKNRLMIIIGNLELVDSSFPRDDEVHAYRGIGGAYRAG